MGGDPLVLVGIDPAGDGLSHALRLAADVGAGLGRLLERVAIHEVPPQLVPAVVLQAPRLRPDRGRRERITGMTWSGSNA